MSKEFAAVIAAIVLIFVGVLAFNGNNSDKSKTGKTDEKSLTQHVQGTGTTGVTLVEYGDYQCPYCQQYYPTVKAVQAQFGDKIKFQFRNFPLTNLHQNAFAAARAAEAAGLQDKFWEMHDVLYEDQNWQIWTKETNPTPAFEQLAKLIGLDTAKFKTDFASTTVNNLINADISEGTRLGVTGTPTFFVNGKKTEFGNTPDAFAKVINEAIAKNAAKKPAATTPAATTPTTPATN